MKKYKYTPFLEDEFKELNEIFELLKPVAEKLDEINNNKNIDSGFINVILEFSNSFSILFIFFSIVFITSFSQDSPLLYPDSMATLVCALVLPKLYFLNVVEIDF